MGKYTDIDDPSAHFQALTYTGNGGTLAVTNDGNSDLQPDWVWTKKRSDTSHHALVDSSRGATKQIYTNLTAAEETVSGVTAFNTDGFTLGSNGTANLNGATFVGWQWKANGGTTASNSDGSVTSTTQVNSDAGFSIVTFDSASSGIFSVGHGLGVKPAFIIVKNREGTSQWRVFHKSLTNHITSIVSLNRTDAEQNYSNFWGAGVTSSVFGLQSGNSATASNDYVAYCFSEKQGYSRFSSYVGNGNANGTFVYTGFKPAFVLWKITSSSGDWRMVDTKRGVNGAIPRIKPNASSAEGSAGDNVDLLSNGFKFRNTAASANASGETYIFMAFASSPFTTSTGIPTTAR